MSEDTVVWPGMVAIEREAAERAIRETREEWLTLFEECRAGLDADSVGLVALALIDAEIRRLRRLLGIKPDAEARRAAPRPASGCGNIASASGRASLCARAGRRKTSRASRRR